MPDLFTFRATTLLTDSPDDDAIAMDLPEGLGRLISAGKDWNVPRRPGMIVRARYAKSRIIPVAGHVKGLGATAAARWTAWRTATDSLEAVMDTSLDPGAVVLFSPYLGLSEDKTLMARCIRMVPGEIHGGDNPMQRWRFELECVDDPPDWTAAESS